MDVCFELEGWGIGGHYAALFDDDGIHATFVQRESGNWTICRKWKPPPGRAHKIIVNNNPVVDSYEFGDGGNSYADWRPKTCPWIHSSAYAAFLAAQTGEEFRHRCKACLAGELLLGCDVNVHQLTGKWRGVLRRSYGEWYLDTDLVDTHWQEQHDVKFYIEFDVPDDPRFNGRLSVGVWGNYYLMGEGRVQMDIWAKRAYRSGLRLVMKPEPWPFAWEHVLDFDLQYPYQGGYFMSRVGTHRPRLVVRQGPPVYKVCFTHDELRNARFLGIIHRGRGYLMSPLVPLDSLY